MPSTEYALGHFGGDFKLTDFPNAKLIRHEQINAARKKAMFALTQRSCHENNVSDGSYGVFEPRTATGSELLPYLTCLCTIELNCYVSITLDRCFHEEDYISRW